MSTAPLPGQINRALDEFHERLLASDAPPLRPSSRTAHVRRRGSLEQGRALEILGHAVEYLVDCNMFQHPSAGNAGNQEAIQILKNLSRAVFLECPEVLPLSRRLQNWRNRVLSHGRRRTPERVMPPC